MRQGNEGENDMTWLAGLQAGRTRAMLPLCLLLFLPAAISLGAADGAALKPAAQDKCPVCGMFVARYPDWTTAIRFKEGPPLFFDGAKDLFKHLLDPKRYPSARSREDIVTVMVKDYYGLSWIDARKAWYVLGSDVFGPMGKELIPLETEGDAREFLKDHKGVRIVRFPDVTPEVMKTLD